MNKAAADAVQSLRPLLRPNSIAIIGASRTPGKSGHSVVRNLVNGGFQGRIFPVNPAGGEIEGLRCYPSVAALPERADCAILVIPAADMVEAVRQCASAGVRTVIVGASGFAETGESEDKQRQDALAVIARDAGMRMLGPNTNGILNTVDRMLLGYNSEYRQRFEPGSISMVSHSGALFGGIARSLRRFGAHLCKFIPVGNEADIDILDVLEFLIHDDATRVIGLIVEGIGNGERLKRLAQIANHLGKPIVALKVGRSTVGAEATMAHSSRLAGSARAYDALFDACSIATVRSVEALSGGCALLADRTPRAGAGDQNSGLRHDIRRRRRTAGRFCGREEDQARRRQGRRVAGRRIVDHRRPARARPNPQPHRHGIARCGVAATVGRLRRHRAGWPDRANRHLRPYRTTAGDG